MSFQVKPVSPVIRLAPAALVDPDLSGDLTSAPIFPILSDHVGLRAAGAGRGCRASGSATMMSGCAGRQPRHLPAPERDARGNGGPVVSGPATRADRDRRPRPASRPRHHLPTCGGRGDLRHGSRHPRRDPPTTAALVMHANSMVVESGRRGRPVTLRIQIGSVKKWRGHGRPNPGEPAHADARRGIRRLICPHNQVISRLVHL